MNWQRRLTELIIAGGLVPASGCPPHANYVVDVCSAAPLHQCTASPNLFCCEKSRRCDNSALSAACAPLLEEDAGSDGGQSDAGDGG